MNTRLQRFAKISAAVLALSASVSAVTAPSPAAADLPIKGPILFLKPDLSIKGWKVGTMWIPSHGGGCTVPALMVDVQNEGPVPAKASVTRIQIAQNALQTFYVGTPAIPADGFVTVAVPFDGNLCGIFSALADAGYDVNESHEANNSRAIVYDCFPSP